MVISDNLQLLSIQLLASRTEKLTTVYFEGGGEEGLLEGFQITANKNPTAVEIPCKPR
jgi:hypothetical protein